MKGGAVLIKMRKEWWQSS